MKIGGTGDNHANRNKIDSERQILCIFVHMWNFLKYIKVEVKLLGNRNGAWRISEGKEDKYNQSIVTCIIRMSK
jgi:hypothetical protein